jgi:hypothetical protein
MKKAFKLIGVAVLFAAIGFSMAACDDDSGGGSRGPGGGTNPGGGGSSGGSLVGTWVSDISSDTFGMWGKAEITFNSNGTYEASVDGTPLMKGNYSTSGNRATTTTTHVHGAMWYGLLESKWYTKAEFKQSFIGMFMPDSDVNELFRTSTGTFSISGNKLTMTENGQTSTYTRK